MNNLKKWEEIKMGFLECEILGGTMNEYMKTAKENAEKRNEK